jgi:ATP-dependent DNA ligase
MIPATIAKTRLRPSSISASYTLADWASVRYADHVEREGIALFKRVCEMDLEGIVAKHSLAPYTTERTTWFKIKNRNYSQELFERECHREPVAGWHSCDLVCAEL